MPLFDEDFNPHHWRLKFGGFLSLAAAVVKFCTP
jgi:hypothetical protein